MKFASTILAAIALVALASSSEAGGGHFRAQRVVVRPQRVRFVQPVYYQQQFVAPIHYQQQFVQPIVQSYCAPQQFVAPVQVQSYCQPVQAFAAPVYSQAVVGGCQSLYGGGAQFRFGY